MKFEEFKSGSYKSQQNYKSFSPHKINQQWVWEDPKINTLLSDANRKIASLDAFALQVPDIDIFIEMHIAKEAVKSSRIEGTQTEIEEALKKESDIAPERKNDWREVTNYIEAMNSSINQLKKLPVSTRLLKDAHKILMKGVRGQHKNPGEFRTSQNWIGGATIQDAIYIPPVHTKINELMSDLEKFLHNDQLDVPILIRAGIAHYQFETIHPFLDGNGRIGRLLITLYLVSTKLLAKPSLYLSDYFEKHRQLYYDNLNNVRVKNDFVQWIKFFLVGIIETSDKGIITFKQILNLKDKIEDNLLPKLGKKLPTAKQLMRYLYRKPVINVQEIQDELKVSLPTANSLIADFELLKILKEKTGYKRNREFEFVEYLNLFKDNK
ncbi:MAG: cell filamentation protein Fic [Ignavibacteriales bacterium UTCHB2]|jgi:Fic family protein|nr:MAG: Adenosine monophosphate-protein transferase SoFic [Ignavibacteria bacterium ADurb.Bin266]OQY71109.1 MAG: cell filamentation protein Fic [Ignavibacteriales bacterium UTCHB2]HQI39788.1 Fic family protein [Ignavibacteriaceae bacterium]HQJ46031.1 Fic family protein [Ignavibacteriaceae bacterium]